MPTLSQELAYVQNFALGAALLWRMTVGYNDASDGKACPLPLLFFVLPILFHEETAAIAISTRKNSGLQLFVEKFSGSTTAKRDLLLGINRRAIEMRPESLEALKLGVGRRLILLRSTTADLYPASTTGPVASIPQGLRPLLSAAEKLGYWFGQRTLFEIQQLLKIHL